MADEQSLELSASRLPLHSWLYARTTVPHHKEIQCKFHLWDMEASGLELSHDGSHSHSFREYSCRYRASAKLPSELQRDHLPALALRELDWKTDMSWTNEKRLHILRLYTLSLPQWRTDSTLYRVTLPACRDACHTPERRDVWWFREVLRASPRWPYVSKRRTMHTLDQRSEGPRAQLAPQSDERSPPQYQKWDQIICPLDRL